MRIKLDIFVFYYGQSIMQIGTSMTLWVYGWKFKFQQEKENIMKVNQNMLTIYNQLP